MTKIKICGITNLDDALLSESFGAHALGFNFYAKSPRAITAEKACQIIDQLQAEVMNVGVFVNESIDRILKIANTAKLNAIQLHGEESPKFIVQLKQISELEIIKAFRVSSDFIPADVLHFDADAVLLDAYSKEGYGGTGETFDWNAAINVAKLFPKIYLAGGLTPENVAEAIKQVRPFAVDVCSGVESSPGIKDRAKVEQFIAEARRTV